MEGKARFKVIWHDGVEWFNTFDDALKFAMKIPTPVGIIHYKGTEILHVEIIETEGEEE